jgi:hypothetical protein
MESSVDRMAGLIDLNLVAAMPRARRAPEQGPLGRLRALVRDEKADLDPRLERRIDIGPLRRAHAGLDKPRLNSKSIAAVRERGGEKEKGEQYLEQSHAFGDSGKHS